MRASRSYGSFGQRKRNEFGQTYDRIIGNLVNMIINPTPWILHKTT